MAGFLRRLVRSKLLNALRFGFQKRRLQQRFRRTLIEVLDRRDLLAGIPAPLSISHSPSDVEHIASPFPSSSVPAILDIDNHALPIGISESFVLQFESSDGDPASEDVLGGSLSSNTAPVAMNDAFYAFSGLEYSESVTDNDFDVDGDSLTVLKTSNVSFGNLDLNSDGTFSYLSNEDYEGYDSFTYFLNNGQLDSNIVTVTIRVRPRNFPPVAVDDSFNVTADDTYINSVGGNDGDEDGETLTFSVDDSPSNGSLSFNSDGTFSYIPNLGFLGYDSFTYHVFDGNRLSNVATVNFNVYVPKGTVVLNANGSFCYTAYLDVYGQDVFTYRSSVGTITSNIATVTINIASSTAPGNVVGRWLYYNNSTSTVFGNGSGNPVNAIDISKAPLLPGETTSFANYSNYARGLNGILVDISGPIGSISASDFQFATWNGITSSGFPPLNASPTIAVYPSSGAFGSNRIKIEFSNRVIQNEWLRVAVLANPNTGLTEPDLFYFGHALGDLNVGNTGSRSPSK